MWILVGLGNPGKEYEDNRHNVGFMVIDEIAREYGLPAFKSKFEGELVEGRIGEEKVVLVKPMTYMNLSGVAVKQILDMFRLQPDNMLVVHDEMDHEMGIVKMKFGGGAGGHNGIASIINETGSENFTRIRIGIGRPKEDTSSADPDWVLGKVEGDEEKIYAGLMPRIVEGIKRWLEFGHNKTMSWFNSREGEAPAEQNSTEPK